MGFGTSSETSIPSIGGAYQCQWPCVCMVTRCVGRMGVLFWLLEMASWIGVCPLTRMESAHSVCALLPDVSVANISFPLRKVPTHEHEVGNQTNPHAATHARVCRSLGYIHMWVAVVPPADELGTGRWPERSLAQLISIR